MLVVNEEIRLPDYEFQFRFARSSGPGGQNVNKTNSKAILDWYPAASALSPPVKARFLARYGARLSTEGALQIACDETRDQRRNKDICLERLAEMIRAVAKPPKVRRATKPTKGSVRRNRVAKETRSDTKKQRQKPSW